MAKIQRIDVVERELKFYPQYYGDKYFGPNPTGRFLRHEDLKANVSDISVELYAIVAGSIAAKKSIEETTALMDRAILGWVSGNA
jgi:hypothetical protein